MLRPYQDAAIDHIRSSWIGGDRKVLLKLATGAGKTVIFCEIIKRAVANGKRVAMITRGRQLVDQASKRLFRENVTHGVLMADHWNRNALARVQVCSVDTMISRGDFPPAGLIVIDEAHLFTSVTSKQVVNHYANAGAFVLAVTATPYTKESLTHLADCVVSPIGINELIQQGYLVPSRAFLPKNPDLSGITMVKGDYHKGELEERMSHLVGDLVTHWKQFAENRPSLLFAVNIKHSQEIVAQFKRSGVKAEHMEGNHSFAEREAAIERLRTGQIQILSNVGIFCTGVDIPFLGCVVMARPTKSYNLHIQQIGRGTRTCPEVGKKDFILLDHAGNTFRHGFITMEPEVHLEGRKREIKIPKMTVCPKCFIAVSGSVCTLCGDKLRFKSSGGGVEVEIDRDGILEEARGLPKEVEISLFKKQCDETRRRRGYKWQWVYYRIKDEYGEGVADRLYPKFKNQPWFK